MNMGSNLRGPSSDLVKSDQGTGIGVSPTPPSTSATRPEPGRSAYICPSRQDGLGSRPLVGRIYGPYYIYSVLCCSGAGRANGI